jgi:hypothetical protein
MIKFNKKIQSEYSKREKYRRPNMDIDPDKKGKGYCIKHAEAIFSIYLRGKSANPYNLVDFYEEMREYGRGTQSTERYKDELIQRDRITTSSTAQEIDADIFTREEKRKAWINVDWSNVSIMPKIKDHIHGLFDNIEFDVVADTVDQNSGAEKEQHKWDMWYNIKFQEQVAKMNQMVGLPAKKYDYDMETLDELEMFEAAGGFKLNYAKAMEKLIGHTFDISNWYQIKRKIIDDLVDLGIAGVRDYYNEETKKIEIRYVDPARVTMQYSPHFDFDDSEYAGEVKEYTVSELRARGFTEKQLKEVAQKHLSYNVNPSRNYWQQFDVQDNSGWKYDFFRIPVFEAVWIDVNTKYQKVRDIGYGRKRIEDAPFGYKTDSKKKQVRKHKIRKIYKCSWIIDTKECFDYGLEYNQVRPNNTKPVLPYRFVLMTHNPITKRLKPIIDDIHRSWYKYQNASALAANAGYAINVRLLQNVELGGEKLKFEDVFKMFRETGHLFYSDVNLSTGGKYEGGAVSPINDLPGGMRGILEEEIRKWDLSLKRIEDLTGLSQFALGMTPSGEQGKATSEMSLSATRTILRPIIDSCFHLKEKTSNTACFHIQMLIKDNAESRKAYSMVVGFQDVEILKQAIGKGVQYGIMLRQKPTDDQRASIINAAQAALNPSRNGEPQITLADYMFIEERLTNGGNLNEIRLYLAYLMRQSEKKAIERQQQAEQANTERAMAMEKQKQEAEMQKFQMEAESNVLVEAAKAENELKLETYKQNQETYRDTLKYAHEEEMHDEEMEVKRQTYGNTV